MRGAYLYPFVFAAGALQAMGVAMNGALKQDLVNPWLAATVSFLPIVFVFATLFLIRPLPLPGGRDLEQMAWWAPLGGVAGAVAVFCGLLFVGHVGAGPFNGLLITANLLTSLALDHFGLIGMPVVRLGRRRLVGAILMIAGVALIAFN